MMKTLIECWLLLVLIAAMVAAMIGGHRCGGLEVIKGGERCRGFGFIVRDVTSRCCLLSGDWWCQKGHVG